MWFKPRFIDLLTGIVVDTLRDIRLGIAMLIQQVKQEIGKEEAAAKARAREEAEAIVASIRRDVDRKRDGKD
ncbi:hypothetical protein HYV73_03050 [Candidatus Uhrbacteria bacterium]|nr:hypothetical protein [Candidatus Uhrbacteria bacterium]